MFTISKPIVSVDWLHENLDQPNLIIIDASLQKVTIKTDDNFKENVYIKNARFLDIKNIFSDTSAPFPNTLLLPDKFEGKAQELGINSDSVIVVYDVYGYYSCARVWWMFKAMGHHNIAVLDGGLPCWKDAKYPIQEKEERVVEKGNFKVKYTAGLIHDYRKVLNSIANKKMTIVDARSYNRFLGVEPEPRKGLRSGHIPNSISLPFADLLNGTKMKSPKELIKLFSTFKNEHFIFSCGSGITACILALGAEIAGINNKSVYDGSWTEWGSLTDLPIEK